jgi:sialidase-1
LSSSFEITGVDFLFSNIDPVKVTPIARYIYHPCKKLRLQGQDNCNTYRIPGIETTKTGTLIAVYDNRYLNSADLQGDINIGMSRSADGGQTWEPMKVIMDMGEWGGKPQVQNGIGDPCILVDQSTNTIWVAALWLHGYAGKTAWYGSQPGLTPELTGQFMLVKSEDDGLTWSPPVSITQQVKNPAWYLMLQGPGKGICMKNGTLVFPAQFKDARQVPFSTLVYSEDHGKTWKSGTGAKSNTTESQVVELGNGNLMLNMRDDRNRTEKGDKNGRAVALTNDMGQTWTEHATSNSALPEPNCMASLISAKVPVNGKLRQVLFFSNPNNRSTRSNMTIKASLDEGATWPARYQVEINENEGYGYSCLTMTDPGTIGILYEGTKELFFQKIRVKDIIK